MARIPGSFNTEEHDEMKGGTILPKGKYIMKIVESEYKQNSAKNGHMLVLVREVVEAVDGDKNLKGRKFYRNLNLDNLNEKAVKIANEELTSTCYACGHKGILEDSEDIHGIEHYVSVGIKTKGKDKPDENTITKLEPIEGGTGDAKEKLKSKSKRKKPIFEEEDDDDEDEDDTEEDEDEEEPKLKKRTNKKRKIVVEDEDDDL